MLQLLRHLLLIATILALGACGATAREQSAAVQAPTIAAPAATTGPAPMPTAGPDQFINPVIERNFPDPDLVLVDDTYYAYATNDGMVHVQSARSTDLVRWEQLDNALPALPAWTQPGLTWAPEVTSWDGGESFVLYFTARDAASDRQCIGAATSPSPEGPFSAIGDTPFICQVDLGGSIDAAAFTDDDGTRYLLWKSDGNCCGRPVYIYIQEVSEDGLSLLGEPVELITNDQLWEGNLVEAPTLWKHEGRYYLFYSANDYSGIDYAIGYAMADAPTGPYTKPLDAPLLATDFGVGAALGPGGQDIVVNNEGETWLIYHSWDATNAVRRMNIDRLLWEDGQPVVEGPDKGPQPRP